MKKATRMLAITAALMCLLTLLASFPVSAATITADTALTAEMMNPNSGVTVTPDGDSFEMQINGDEVMEVALAWTVEVDVTKTPYWIIQVQSMWLGNRPSVLCIANDNFVGKVLKEGYMVVDLRKYAQDGVFKGDLTIRYQDYYSSKLKQGRSVTKMAHWVSSSEDLGGKLNADDRHDAVDFLTVVESEKVFKASEGYAYDGCVMTPVDEYGFDMMVDPDQEIESYISPSRIAFTACVDTDKVPYIHVDLGELETSFVGVIRVLDPTSGGDVRGRNMDYVVPGNSGVVTYDLREYAGKGVQYLSFDICVDDGYAANGALNYIRYVWLDNNENASAPSVAEDAPPATDTTPESSDTAPESSEPASAPESSDAAPESSEPASAPESSDAAPESSEPASTPESSDVQTGTDGEDEPDDGSLLLIILLVVAAVVVVGGGVAAFLIIKKKKA